MQTLQPSIIKIAVSASLIIGLLGATVGCTAIASSYEDQPVYRGDNNNNANFGRISKQLRQDLRRSGYNVMDIQPDNYRGNQSLIVYAKKNNQPYVLRYTYPGLKQISVSKKEWSNIWQDNNKNRQDNNKRYGNGHYSNNKYKNKNDQYKNNSEDRIQKEARYPVIKQRAINKVNDMGYRVNDIDFKEKNNRGIFEIEAKRGSQEYEITLGYPNLDVIKIEKD